MDGYNLFEPDLELDVNTIPYEDMGIQGVWPRKQRTPSDVFPANANLVARGDNNKARWCKADEDGILYTHDIGGGGGSSTSKEKLQTQGVSDSGPESDGLLFAIATGPGELNTLFRVQITIDIPAPHSGDIEVGNCSIYLNPEFFGNTYIWHYIDDTIVSSTDKTFWVRDTVIFNPGWDLVNEVPVGSDIGFYGRKVGGCLYSCIIWYS